MTTMHPAGSFDARILNHGWNKSQYGTLQFTVDFETEHGSIRGYFYMSDKAVENTVKKIRAMGFDEDDLDLLTDGTYLQGALCSITVDHEEYNGQVRAKVGFVNAYGYSPEIKRDSESGAKAKMFNALLKKTAPGKIVRKESEAKQAKPKTTQTINGEDYPPVEAYDDSFDFGANK